MIARSDDRSAPRRMTRVRASIIASLAISALGGWFHNIREFPGMSLVDPEMLATLVPALTLMVWWWLGSGVWVWWVTLGWVLLNLIVGAVLSVLPLPIWPFAPAQTTEHYLSHAIYALAQIPALWALRASRQAVFGQATALEESR